MAYLQPVRKISFSDSPSIDGFARLRVSNPVTLFDSKQINDNQPLFWDDQEILGSGTGSVWSKFKASSTLSVSNLTVGKRIRRTYRRFNYQPGKSQLIFMTYSDLLSTSGIKKWVQLGDDNNGFILRHENGIANFILRSNTTGTPIETLSASQSSWNIDKLDGSGESNINLDFSKSQILILDFEWLGVGRVRFGFVVDGIPVYAHQFNNANNLVDVYLSTPNLPLEYGIENDGTGPASSMQHICSTVISEGGQETLGVSRYASNDVNFLNADTIGVVYASLGIRLKSTYEGLTIKIADISNLCATTDNIEWMLIWNPTVAGTFTYIPETSSGVEIAVGTTTNTVTGGIYLGGGHIGGASSRGGAAISQINSLLSLGQSINGILDRIILGIKPLSANADVYSGINWREVS